MKLGYPCLNYTLKCLNSSFRLKSYSEQRMIETIDSNLSSLIRILQFNVDNGLLFFRISSEIIPFASHPVCQFNWQSYFQERLQQIGAFIKKHKIRISMHPDQFVVLNSKQDHIISNSINELMYHQRFLDILELDDTAKIQIHVGGIYGNKTEVIKKFIATYNLLEDSLKRRLVIENDDKLFNLNDCMNIYQDTGIPIIFDTLHHQCLNNQETMLEAMITAQGAWQDTDGVPMIDYSTQEPNARLGKHASTLEIDSFKDFIILTKGLEFDIMLEIKDKELSAVKALNIINLYR